MSDHIPTSEVRIDLSETEAEASQFDAELVVLKNNPYDGQGTVYVTWDTLDNSTMN